MRNPCLDCEWHLAGGDKDADRCIRCSDRAGYAAAIGGMAEGVPIYLMTAMGAMGHPTRPTVLDVDERQKHADKRLVEMICQCHGVDPDLLKTRRRMPNLTEARREILATFSIRERWRSDEYVAKLSGWSIGTIRNLRFDLKFSRNRPDRVSPGGIEGRSGNDSYGARAHQ